MHAVLRMIKMKSLVQLHGRTAHSISRFHDASRKTGHDGLYRGTDPVEGHRTITSRLLLLQCSEQPGLAVAVAA